MRGARPSVPVAGPHPTSAAASFGRAPRSRAKGGGRPEVPAPLGGCCRYGEAMPMSSTTARRLVSALLTIALGLTGGTGPASAATGDLDPAFGIDGRAEFPAPGEWFRATDLDVGASGDVTVTGTFYDPVSSEPKVAIARLSTDGTLDPSFGAGGTWIGASGAISPGAAVRPDGSVVVAVGTQVPRARGARPAISVFVLDAHGDVVPSFGEGGARTVRDRTQGGAVVRRRCRGCRARSRRRHRRCDASHRGLQRQPREPRLPRWCDCGPTDRSSRPSRATASRATRCHCPGSAVGSSRSTCCWAPTAASSGSGAWSGTTRSEKRSSA